MNNTLPLYFERAVIEVNGGCNYTCEMCPQTNPGRPKGFLRKMPLDEFRRYVEECFQHGLKVVNLEGSGEATLNRDLPEYIKIVSDYGVKSYIFSNGFKLVTANGNRNGSGINYIFAAFAENPFQANGGLAR